MRMFIEEVYEFASDHHSRHWWIFLSKEISLIRIPKSLPQCAKCGASSKNLQPIESGHICLSCLQNGLEGRDLTTKAIRTAKYSPLDQASTEAGSPSKAGSALTKANTDQVALDAAQHRNQLLTYLGNDCAALALDAEVELRPQNPIEQMITHQIALAHKAAMETASKGFLAGDPADQTRLLNLSARFMEVCQRGALTLQRLQGGGQQQITVQHVSVAQGGQAVIGNVKTGERP